MTATSPSKLIEIEGDLSDDSSTKASQSDDDSDESIMDDEFNGSFDGDAENEMESDESLEDSGKGNTGWADSMAKILKSNKPKNKKSLVLSKAKISFAAKENKEEKLGFEIIDEVKPAVDSIPVKTEEDSEPKSKKRREIHPDLRVKPNILEKERERILAKTATRGVVQLFNTVRNQQKDIEKRMDEAGPLERKKDKVIKSLDKTKFLDMLMGESKSENVNKTLAIKKKAEVVKKEDPSTWNVFREDFMMGAKMKDWDKKEREDEENDEEENILSESDSD